MNSILGKIDETIADKQVIPKNVEKSVPLTELLKDAKRSGNYKKGRNIAFIMLYII